MSSFLPFSCPFFSGSEGDARICEPGVVGLNAAASLPRRLALRIGTIKIGLLAGLLKRDRNERPRSHEIFGRGLRVRLLTRQKNSENQR
jgi:hypothetical protein